MTAALLDTDTLSLLRKGHPQVSFHAASHLKKFGQLVFTELSYYEVTRGLKAKGATAQLTDFERFCQLHQLLPLTHTAVTLAADIWADLKQRGQLIGEVDLLIAGIALSERLAVVTHNTSHFSRITGLSLIDWTI